MTARSDEEAIQESLIYNALEMPDNAFGWLEKAYEQRDRKMTFLKVEPTWNNLRTAFY